MTPRVAVVAGTILGAYCHEPSALCCQKHAHAGMRVEDLGVLNLLLVQVLVHNVARQAEDTSAGV